MILKHSAEVPAEPIEKPGFSRMNARFLLLSSDGCPRYALRLMEFAPGGYTSYHNHKEEHEIFIFEGEGVVVDGEKKEHPIRVGDAIFALPCEFHQIRNTGSGMLRMVCTVPLLPGGTGKNTTPCG